MKLISILFAVAIIAMLTVYGIRTWSSSGTKETGESAIEEASDVRRITDLESLESAVMHYHLENYQYPSILSDLVPEFISSLPVDPETGENYGYKKTSSSYKLYCKLADKEKMKNDEGTDPDYYELIGE